MALRFHRDEDQEAVQLHEVPAFLHEAASGEDHPCRAHGKTLDGDREDSRDSPDAGVDHFEGRKDIRVAGRILAEGEDPAAGNHAGPEDSLGVAGGHTEMADAVQGRVEDLEVHCP